MAGSVPTQIVEEARSGNVHVVKAQLGKEGSFTTEYPYYGFVTRIEVEYGETPPSAAWTLHIEDEFALDLTGGRGAEIDEECEFRLSHLRSGIPCHGPITFWADGLVDDEESAIVTFYVARFRATMQ